MANANHRECNGTGENRQGNGRFALGNPGGPGRPRRAVERDYLIVLSESVTLDDWRAIIQKTVDAAKNGDAKARDWLARHLVGDKPLTLTALAADEAAGLDAERDVLESLAERLEEREHKELYQDDEYEKARKILKKAAKRAKQQDESEESQ